MTILIDRLGHMVSTESATQLHSFAYSIGLKRQSFQNSSFGQKHPHYDITTERMTLKAVRHGAILVSPFVLVKKAWWKRKAYNKEVL